MPAWATVTVTLGASAIAVLGTLGAALLQHGFAKKEALRREAVERRERAAAVIGPISTLLVDAEPGRLALNAGPRSANYFQALSDRWGSIRDDLATWAAEYPAPEARGLADRLDAAVTTSITMSGHVVGGLLHPHGLDDTQLREIGQRAYDRAHELLELLAGVARADLGPDEIAAQTAALDAS